MSHTQATEHPFTNCRRCRRAYILRRTILPSCPHCGAAPVPLRHRLRHNGVAATLALAALVTLSFAIFMPFISMTRFGQRREFSLIGGILELFDTGDWLIGSVLLTFSVVFPFAKLLALLVATSALLPISKKWRRRLHHLALVTGKYSLLDILVVAIIIVLVKFHGIAEARALPGTTLFCVAIFMSILAGFAVNFGDDEEGTPPAAAAEQQQQQQQETSVQRASA
jgi:paraquat-inducible protein A